jgi:hypothetical protein
MNIPDKTPEQLMEEYNVKPWGFYDPKPTPPDYHTMALLAAQTLPNQSAAELLSSADKIEAWLRKYHIQQKSTDSYVGASQDTNVFP